MRKDGTPLKPPMAYGWYKNISDADMKPLIAYLRTLKPLPLGGDAGGNSAGTAAGPALPARP